MKNHLFPILLIILSIVIFLFVVEEQYGRMMAMLQQRQEIEEAEESFEELQDLAQKLKERSQSDQTQEHYQILNEFLPPVRDDARTMISIQNVLNETGLILHPDRGVSFSLNEGPDPGAVGEQGLDEQGIGVKNINLEFEHRYSTLKNLLRKLESDIRIYDVTSLEIESVTANRDSFNIGIQTYWVK